MQKRTGGFEWIIEGLSCASPAVLCLSSKVQRLTRLFEAFFSMVTERSGNVCCRGPCGTWRRGCKHVVALFPPPGLAERSSRAERTVFVLDNQVVWRRNCSGWLLHHSALKAPAPPKQSMDLLRWSAVQPVDRLL